MRVLPFLAAVLIVLAAGAASAVTPPSHHHRTVNAPVYHLHHHPAPRHATGRHIERKRAAGAAAAAASAAAAAEAASAASASAGTKPAPSPPAATATGSVTGLKIPRFASLRAEEVNLRSGPGTRYPIQWVYKRRDLPVEIEREYDVWRLVVDADGTRGWVHEATLIGTRSFVTRAARQDDAGTGNAGAGNANGAAEQTQLQTLRAGPADDSAPRAYLKPGVIGRILSCAGGADWCHVAVHGIDGYLRRDAMWGLLPGEVVGAS